jgi:hypothetical protein
MAATHLTRWCSTGPAHATGYTGPAHATGDILAIYWRYTGDILAHSPHSPYRPSLPPQDLTSVRDIMTQNIQDVLGRGEALDCAPGWG